MYVCARDRKCKALVDYDKKNNRPLKGLLDLTRRNHRLMEALQL